MAAPAMGALESGAPGFCKGALAGVAAAVVLPAVGVAVGATQIVRGVANTPNAIKQVRKALWASCCADLQLISLQPWRALTSYRIAMGRVEFWS